MLRGMAKFMSHANGTEEPHDYGNVFQRQKTTGPERLVIGASNRHVELLRELFPHLEPEYWVLYVLTVTTVGNELGRYQSPVLDAPVLDSLLAEFDEFFEGDARHAVWIANTAGTGQLIYDQHNLIYAYGPLDTFEATLHKRGFREVDELTVPAPHMHRYNRGPFTRWEVDLLDRFDWHRTDLRDGDDE